MTGYMGDRCEEDVDECLDTPCGADGTCTVSSSILYHNPAMMASNVTPSQNMVGAYECACKDGDKGMACYDDCDPNPCKNGGTCTVIITYYCRGTGVSTGVPSAGQK